MKKPTERFTETVEDYVKYRPSYPIEVLHLLINECHLTQTKIVADIGSGTGILSKILLDYGCTVYGVEPNQSMREAAENYLKMEPHFYSVDGSAENTALANESVDMVTVATAFHWFDAVKSKIEFKRILKAPGWVVLIWNVRNKDESNVVRDYENLILKYCADYRESNAEKFDKVIVEEFFSPYEMLTQTFHYAQQFNWEGLKGRLLSSSYSLRLGDEKFEEMLNELKNIFNRHQKNGSIDFLYRTKVYYGHLHPMSK